MKRWNPKNSLSSVYGGRMQRVQSSVSLIFAIIILKSF